MGKSKPNAEALTEVAVKFNDAIRWSVYEKAALCVPPSGRNAFWDMADKLRDNVRITEYEMRNINVVENSGTADINLACRFYAMNDPRLRYVALHQKWVYNWGARAWQVAEPGWDRLSAKDN